MEYLVRKRMSGKAHYWDGLDTTCRMASTGGLNLKRYRLSEHTGGRQICFMCQTVVRSVAEIVSESERHMDSIRDERP